MPHNLALNGVGTQTASKKEVNIAAKEPDTNKESFKNVLRDNNTHTDKPSRDHHPEKDNTDTRKAKHDSSSHSHSRSQKETHSTKASEHDQHTQHEEIDSPKDESHSVESLTLQSDIDPSNIHPLASEQAETGQYLQENDHGILSGSLGANVLTTQVIDEYAGEGDNAIEPPLSLVSQQIHTAQNKAVNHASVLSGNGLREGVSPLAFLSDKNLSVQEGVNPNVKGAVSNLTPEQATSQIKIQQGTDANLTGSKADTQTTSFFDMLQNGHQKTKAFEFNSTALSASNAAQATDVTSSTQSYTQALSKLEGASMMTSTEAKPSFAVSVQFGQAAWSGAIAKQTANILMQNIQSAELRLNPDDLGPINVKVNVNQDQASVMFQSNNPAVREALDQAMPRLRDLLSQEGLNLLESHVGDHPDFSGNQQNDQEAKHASQQHTGETSTQDEATPIQTLNVRYGVDSYA